MLFTQLKKTASENNLELKPETINCDFEKGAIKAIKLHFPNAKIRGCHFHFSSAIHKQVGELGLKKVYSENKEFKTWIRMVMSFPFLMIKYFEKTWLNDNCHFDRSTWNLFTEYSSRTNNICESYNHQLNGQVLSSKSNIYKIITLNQKQESLASTSYERVNLGMEKKTKTAQQLKDVKIENLKLKYKHCEIDVMSYLMQVSVFGKEWDD